MLLKLFLLDSNYSDAQHLTDNPGVYCYFLSDVPICVILHGNLLDYFFSTSYKQEIKYHVNCWLTI